MTVEDHKPPRRNRAARRVQSFSIALVVSVAAGLVIGMLHGVTQESDLGRFVPAWVTAALLFLLLAAVLWVSLLWWRDIDELAKQAHHTAWFWGGSVGMIVGWLSLSFANSLPAPLAALVKGSDPDLLLWRGGTVVAVAAFVGYGLWWAVFWLRRR